MPFVILLNTIKNLPIIILLVVLLALSIYTVTELKKIQTPDAGQATIEALKTNLDSHQELKKFSAQYPRVTYLTDAFLAQAAANNLIFFKDAQSGDYLLEYAEATIIYNPRKDKIINMQEIELAPADLLDKLTSNTELENYKGIRPNLIIKVNKDNLENLKQQINGLDESFLGTYILNYNDRIVIYDYQANQIKSNIALQAQAPVQATAQLPADFFAKLLAHPELKGYETESPNGRQLDQATLSQLQQNYPMLYQNANVGDFILQYSKKLIIYDYENDEVKDAFDLQ